MRRTVDKNQGQQLLDFFFIRKTENLSIDENKIIQEKIPSSTVKQIPSEKPLPEVNGSLISLSDFELEPSSSIDEDSQLSNESEQNDGEFNEDTNSEDFDYGDSDVSSPKADQSTNRSTIMTRHHSTEEPKIIDDIFTPTWAIENPNEDEKAAGNINYDFNTICNVHFQLEIIEKRIQNGEDEEHEHPAMCVQVLSENGLADITEEEIQYRQTYKVRKVRKIKPSFWEPRCYDNEYATLTKNDNRRLRDAIRNTEFNNNCLSKKLPEVIEWEPEDELIPCKNDHKCLLKLPSLSANQNSEPFEFKSFISNQSFEDQNRKTEYVKEPVFTGIPIRPKKMLIDSQSEIPEQPKKKLNKAIKKHKAMFESSSEEEFKPVEEIISVPKKESNQPMRIIRFSSLLFDTDDELTDADDF